VTTLKRGSLYVLPLTANGQGAAGHMSRYFQSDNRYRDTAVSPDGKTIHLATDQGGMGEAVAGGATRTMQNPGAILAFTYDCEGEGAPTVISDARPAGSISQPSAPTPSQALPRMQPRFTRAQAVAGKTAYNSNCAVCHGNTMTNGTFAPPLAGEAFKTAWSGKTVRTLFVHAKTMPPASPASLADDTYTNIVAYVLEVNGFKAGKVQLPAGGEALDKMTLH
jgi:mono/diheme cytochrome c family protein